MAAKEKGRVAPRIDHAELVETFLAQVEYGKACDALASGIELAGLGPSRGVPVRVDGCVWRQVTLLDGNAQRMTMRDCRVERSELAQINLTGATLERVEFVATRMTGAAMIEARLKSVLFEECKLDFAAMRMAALTNCVFDRCNLTDADLYCADLSGAVFRGCDFSRADVSGAKLGGERTCGTAVWTGCGGRRRRRTGSGSVRIRRRC